MNATLAPTAAPSNPILIEAGKMWCDHSSIYVQLNGAEPCILKFQLCEAGLWKALTLLRSKKYDFAGTPVMTRKLDPRIAAAQEILKRRAI